MIFIEKPDVFEPKFEVVGCFVQCGEEIVMLHRLNHKPQGGTWGLPSGKIDLGETLHETVCRETREETGLEINLEEIKFFKSLFVKYPDYDFVYHIFSVELNEKPEIKISPSEHQDFRWVTPSEALELPFIEDLDGCIKLFYDI